MGFDEVAVTENVADPPRLTVWLAGCAVMTGWAQASRADSGSRRASATDSYPVLLQALPYPPGQQCRPRVVAVDADRVRLDTDVGAPRRADDSIAREPHSLLRRNLLVGDDRPGIPAPGERPVRQVGAVGECLAHDLHAE